MPVSLWIGIEKAVQSIMARQPRSILDVGVGFGLWGYLCRFYLDVWNGRYQREKWRIVIDGVEVFPNYLSVHQRYLYNTLYEKNAMEILDVLPTYDLVILGDILEHFPKQDGINLLEKSYQRAKSFMLVRLPLGIGWERGEWLGNPYEAHQSIWDWEDFKNYNPLMYEYSFQRMHYGLVILDKDTSSRVHTVDYLRLYLEGIEQQVMQGKFPDYATIQKQLKRVRLALQKMSLDFERGMSEEAF